MGSIGQGRVGHANCMNTREAPAVHYPNLHKQVTPGSCVIAGIGQGILWLHADNHAVYARSGAWTSRTKVFSRVGCDEWVDPQH